MYLLVMILEKASDLENILTRFQEIGVTGATIFHSSGVGRTTLYGTDAPLIASLRRLFDREAIYNHTVFSIIKTKKTLEEALAAAQEVCGTFDEPDVGILFTVKLDQVIGFTSTSK